MSLRTSRERHNLQANKHIGHHLGSARFREMIMTIDVTARQHAVPCWLFFSNHHPGGLVQVQLSPLLSPFSLLPRRPVSTRARAKGRIAGLGVPDCVYCESTVGGGGREEEGRERGHFPSYGFRNWLVLCRRLLSLSILHKYKEYQCEPKADKLLAFLQTQYEASVQYT